MCLQKLIELLMLFLSLQGNFYCLAWISFDILLSLVLFVFFYFAVCKFFHFNSLFVMFCPCITRILLLLYIFLGLYIPQRILCVIKQVSEIFFIIKFFNLAWVILEPEIWLSNLFHLKFFMLFWIKFSLHIYI